MKSNINAINAGIIHTQSRMAGFTVDQALETARTAPLHADLNATPHRATVVRLLKAMWARVDAETARFAAQRRAAEEFDAAVAEAFPEDWARACAKEGKKRREAKRALRKRYAPARYAGL